MKKKIIIIVFVFIIIIGIISIMLLGKKYPYEDENTLYYIEFKNEILRYERYDYSSDQSQIVGVEKSTNKGKSFENVTKEPIILSMEPKLIFLNEKLGFAISKSNLTKNNDYMGFKVTQDGGETFIDSKINYDNPNIDILTIESVPYYENNDLKVKCSIYQVKEDNSGYENVELIFISKDDGLTWELEINNDESISERKKNLDNLIKNEMIDKGYLDEENLDVFHITDILVDGYYKSEETKKYMQIDFKASCKDKSKKCVINSNYYEEKEYYTIWIVTDEKNIFEFKTGISLNMGDIESGKYVRVNEIIK